MDSGRPPLAVRKVRNIEKYGNLQRVVCDLNSSGIYFLALGQLLTLRGYIRHLDMTKTHKTQALGGFAPILSDVTSLKRVFKTYAMF